MVNSISIPIEDVNEFLEIRDLLYTDVYNYVDVDINVELNSYYIENYKHAMKIKCNTTYLNDQNNQVANRNYLNNRLNEYYNNNSTSIRYFIKKMLRVSLMSNDQITIFLLFLDKFL